LNFKKELGQNFIFNRNLLHSFVEKSNVKDKKVLEIGAGSGALTFEIARVASEVVAVEIDKDLQPGLDKLASSFTNLKIVIADILKVDFDEYNDYVIIGNIPYYITKPIINKFIHTKGIDKSILLVQKELAVRLTANPKDTEYGLLTVMVGYVCNVKILTMVGRVNFKPIPNVDSALISLEKRENIDYDYLEEFENFLKQIFTFKRKTLLNNLLNSYVTTKEDVYQFLDELKIKKEIRVQELSINEIVNFHKLWKQKEFAVK
jgi:16S rRNA (adenine1518-N6/adenine1519-N6)-dimethyltransferase